MKKELIVLIIACLYAAAGQARILRVNNTPGVAVEFTGIAAAYAEAVDGDTIYVEGSSTAYFSHGTTITIDKRITIQGPGYYLTQNGLLHYGADHAYLGDATKLAIKASGVVVCGIRASGIQIYASDVVITRCFTQGITLDLTSNVVLHQNYINGGILGHTGGYQCSTNIQITNNIIYGADMERLQSSLVAYNHINIFNFSSNYSTTFKNNMVKTRDTTFDMKMDGTNSFDTTNYKGDWASQCVGGESGFTTDKDYQLLPNSPLMTMSSDGGQIGAFGGSDPYVISGIPNAPLIRSLEVPASVNQTDGLQVKMTITTER